MAGESIFGMILLDIAAYEYMASRDIAVFSMSEGR